MTLTQLRKFADCVAKKLWGKEARGTVLHSLEHDKAWIVTFGTTRRGWRAQGHFETKGKAWVYLQGMHDALERKGR